MSVSGLRSGYFSDEARRWVAGRCPASVCSRGPHTLRRAPMSEFDLQTFKIFFDLLSLDDDKRAPTGLVVA